MLNICNKNNFVVSGVWVEAYITTTQAIKKYVIFPKNRKENNKTVYDKRTGSNIKCNGIAIHTEESNLTTIDVDKPEECPFLNDLLKDCKTIVKTRKGYHFYFKRCDKLARRKLCTIADINTDVLFYIPTYKNIDNNEEYTYTLIKDEGLTDIPDYAFGWCVGLINMAIKQDEKPKIINNNKPNKVLNAQIEIKKFSVDTLRIIYDILNLSPLNSETFATYEGWTKIGYMSRHLNNSSEAFTLFDEYCRKVKGYENVDINNNIKCFYGKNEYNLNFDENCILFKCQNIDPVKYNDCLKHLYKSKYDERIIKFDSQYLNPSDRMFNEWLTDYKILAIKSPYGTGKTYTFKRMLDINQKFKRVLFITYRRSLANSLCMELSEKYGFINYLDLDDGYNFKSIDRLILQIDSIKKLTGKIDILTQESDSPVYDLIVLDECEGLLNHLSYNQISQYITYNLLEQICLASSKILALDGDMDERSYDFLNSISNSYNFYVNTWTNIKKHFIFMHDTDVFNKQIDDDLKNNKKIVIVSMLMNITEVYYHKYKDKYKVIIHNSIQKNKDVLCNVNDEWGKCDLLIYSPSIEAGVDFNIKNYFYKMYVVLSNNSTSPRALNQMMNRVRHYETNDIPCLISNGMIFYTKAVLYRYDEIRLKKYYGIEMSSLLNVIIHNDAERINAVNYFISVLVKLITEKGHTYEHIEKANTLTNELETIAELNNNNNDYTGLASLIANANDVDRDEAEYLEYLEKTKEELCRDQKYALLKYNYSKKFKIDSKNITEDFMNDHINKLHYVDNFSMLNRDKIMMTNKSYIKDKDIEKVDKIKELLTKCGYTIEDYRINKGLGVEYDIIKDEITNFLLDKNNQVLFCCERKWTINKFVGLINNLLECYGIEFNSSSERIGYKERKRIYKMELRFTDIFQKYIERLKN